MVSLRPMNSRRSRFSAWFSNIGQLWGMVLPAKLRIDRPDGQILTTKSMTIDLIQAVVFGIIHEIEQECRKQCVQSFLNHEAEFLDQHSGFLLMMLSEKAQFKVLLSTGRQEMINNARFFGVLRSACEFLLLQSGDQASEPWDNCLCERSYRFRNL